MIIIHELVVTRNLVVEMAINRWTIAAIAHRWTNPAKVLGKPTGDTKGYFDGPFSSHRNKHGHIPASEYFGEGYQR